MSGLGVYTLSDGTKLEGQWEESGFVAKADDLSAKTE
jgi:hypothetical protein